MSLKLGGYVQLFEGTKNTQRSTSVEAVALNSSNEKGGYYFISLRTGRKLHGFIWTVPITEELIARFKDLGEEDKQQLKKNGPIFEWIPGNIVLDKQEDEEDFDNPINDLKHQHNDDDNSDYIPENSDGDDNILGSWEAKYAAMDKEEVIIVTYDNIAE